MCKNRSENYDLPLFFVTFFAAADDDENIICDTMIHFYLFFDRFTIPEIKAATSSSILKIGPHQFERCNDLLAAAKP